MNIFDILGPVMVGPSSSHTAGADRIGLMARKLLAEGTPCRADITLYNSFAASGQGHGTDRALIAGLLGMKPDDERIAVSFDWAAAAEMSFTFQRAKSSAEHPNTAHLEVESKTGRRLSMTAASLGGGRIQVTELNGLNATFSGELPTLIVQNVDKPGCVGIVTSLLAHDNVNIATVQLHRDHPGGNAVMVIEADKNIPQKMIDRLTQIDGILSVVFIDWDKNR